ncbi:hypothetical protein GCM10007859_08540 [Brevundimonas denitrificans]|uniref:PH (Pleckstrin Homology) domain-containing protein n=1 Tax=Brevundimonas denitrificans TaxID=1443434 RepID=A0ABQ6BIF4_9CAUL|nr:hypothetical protein [Brevundimonas denitrificans]GLS00845.1 hypothetical protein GCM10007859_08540 [Brevundimonas denitrificans]
MTRSLSAEGSGAVIETSKIVYGAWLFAWVFVAFLSTALIALDGTEPDTVFIAVPIIGILFSATGILRPKRIQLNREALAYRPVWGPRLVLRRTDIASFDVFVLHYSGSGFLICKMRPEVLKGGGRYNLGFDMLPDELVKALRRWLGRTP